MAAGDQHIASLFDIGDERAPMGTEPWAKRIRLRLQALTSDISAGSSNVSSLRRCVEAFQQHRAWTLLRKSDGKPFATWEEFCATSQNDGGLGKPWEYLKPFVEAVAGKQAVQLATVAPAKSPPGKAEEKAAERPLVSTTKDKTLRAILRAPAEVQDLYRDGLISQKVAAKLGPKNPAKAPSRELIVEALKDIPRERKAIDAKVREVLGERKPSRVEQAVKLVALMSAAELKRFFEAVEQYRR